MKRLFMFWNKPTNNFLGTDGSSTSIEIMTNGDVIERRYPTLDDRVFMTQIVKNSTELVRDLTEVIERNHEEISNLPDFVDNGTFDGNWQTFIFGNKKVTVDNLDDPEIEHTKVRNPEYFKEYRVALYQTEFLWSIYNELKDIFRKYDIDLWR